MIHFKVLFIISSKLWRSCSWDGSSPIAVSCFRSTWCTRTAWSLTPMILQRCRCPGTPPVTLIPLSLILILKKPCANPRACCSAAVGLSFCRWWQVMMQRLTTAEQSAVCLTVWVHCCVPGPNNGSLFCPAVTLQECGRRWCQEMDQNCPELRHKVNSYFYVIFMVFRAVIKDKCRSFINTK